MEGSKKEAEETIYSLREHIPQSPLLMCPRRIKEGHTSDKDNNESSVPMQTSPCSLVFSVGLQKYSGPWYISDTHALCVSSPFVRYPFINLLQLSLFSTDGESTVYPLGILDFELAVVTVWDLSPLARMALCFMQRNKWAKRIVRVWTVKEIFLCCRSCEGLYSFQAMGTLDLLCT